MRGEGKVESGKWKVEADFYCKYLYICTQSLFAYPRSLPSCDLYFYFFGSPITSVVTVAFVIFILLEII